MNHSTQIHKLAHLLLYQNPKPTLSPKTLIPKIHPQLITSNFHHCHTQLKQFNTQFEDDPFVYASLIKSCNKSYAIRAGKSIHCHVLKLGFYRNVNVLNALVHLYSSSGKLMKCACALFDEIPEKSVVSVNCMLSGFFTNKLFDEGLSLLVRVLGGRYGSGLRPNFVTFVILISWCSKFGKFGIGVLLHTYCYKTGLSLRNELGNALIDMYAKFGCMDDAKRLFCEIPDRDLVSWNTMIGGYAKNNDFRKAFLLFKEMRDESIKCDRVSFINLITACANSRDIKMGKMVHGYIKAAGLQSNVPVGVALINMYCKCGLIEFASTVFEELPKNNIASWNSIIHGYVSCGLFHEALGLFNLIKHGTLVPDETTILGLISACRGSGELYHGINIHTFIDCSDYLNNCIVLKNALLDMYVKCSSMTRAKSLFDKMKVKDVISWTTIIVGHAINGEGKEAIAAFSKMGDNKIEPNSITFIGLLLACDHAGLIDDGKRLYGLMHRKHHIEPKIEHCGCIVDMHARAGMLEAAHDFVNNMPMEPNDIIWRMLINACRVHRKFNMGLGLVNGIKELNASYRSEDYVILSNIFAETGRWDDVLHSRSLMVVQKDAGKTRFLMQQCDLTS